MKKGILKKILTLSVFFMGLSALVFFLPMTGYGAAGDAADYAINVNVSANIINLDSERLGAIRIFTSVRYSTYQGLKGEAFIYFNSCKDSIANIHASRDSLGNLILRFNLEELFKTDIVDYLLPNEFNEVRVVVSMSNGDIYEGVTQVYLNKKKKLLQ